MSTPEHARHILAQQIADALFASGNGEKAENLTLRHEDGTFLGGWCREAAIDRIEKVIERAKQTMKTQKKTKTVSGLLAELEEMYDRANQWEKPYDGFPLDWPREASHIACPLLCEIMRRLKKVK